MTHPIFVTLLSIFFAFASAVTVAQSEPPQSTRSLMESVSFNTELTFDYLGDQDVLEQRFIKADFALGDSGNGFFPEFEEISLQYLLGDLNGVIPKFRYVVRFPAGSFVKKIKGKPSKPTDSFQMSLDEYVIPDPTNSGIQLSILDEQGIEVRSLTKSVTSVAAKLTAHDLNASQWTLKLEMVAETQGDHPTLGQINGAVNALSIFTPNHFGYALIRSVSTDISVTGHPALQLLTVTPSSGSLPLNVKAEVVIENSDGLPFDVPFDITWNFGEGPLVTKTVSAGSPATITESADHTYNSDGVFVVRVFTQEDAVTILEDGSIGRVPAVQQASTTVTVDF